MLHVSVVKFVEICIVFAIHGCKRERAFLTFDSFPVQTGTIGRFLFWIVCSAAACERGQIFFGFLWTRKKGRKDKKRLIFGEGNRVSYAAIGFISCVLSALELRFKKKSFVCIFFCLLLSWIKERIS